MSLADAAPQKDTEQAAYRRLRAAAPLTPPPQAVAAPGGVALIDNRRDRAFGTAVHRALESLVYRQALPNACDDALVALLRATLLAAGADRPGLDELSERGREALDCALADGWLRWALDPARPLRRAEHPLTRAAATGSQSLVLDYVFVDESSGEHWVVDYKTAAPGDGEEIERFTAIEAERYAPQLAAYRSALVATGVARVRCALYFPVLGTHLELSTDQLQV